MSIARLNYVLPKQVAEFAQVGGLRAGLQEAARAIGAEVTIEEADPGTGGPLPREPGMQEFPIHYRGQSMGQVQCCADGDEAPVIRTAAAMRSVLEYALCREMAINDLAGALTTSYEELSMLHNLLSDIAVRTDATEIGELLVDETMRTLNCRRVSLLVVDDRGKYLKVLAARGLPEEARSILIPADYSVAGHVLSEDGLLMVDDIADYPELVGLSRGNYETGSFAIVRVPLSARGEAVGVLTATERNGAPEFTARDRKLFEGLSSIGASALLSCRLHATVNEQMMSTIQALATAVDAKDHYTHDHSGRVARLCVATVRHMGIIDPTTCREVELAGLLHDIGKIGIPDSILSKTEGLTAQEYTTVKSHAHIGAKIVEQVKGLERVAKAIRHHHERHDGLGYPLGLTGASIPLASKLISAADVFDTLTSDRPYRKRVSPEEAIRELRQSAGTQQDPAVVEALIAVVRQETKLSKRAKQQHVVGCEPT